MIEKENQFDVEKPSSDGRAGGVSFAGILFVNENLSNTNSILSLPLFIWVKLICDFSNNSVIRYHAQLSI